MFRSFVLGLLLVSTSFIYADDKAEKVMKDLQGAWKVEKMIEFGKEVPKEDLEELVFTYKGDKISLNVEKDSVTYKLDVGSTPIRIEISPPKTKRKELAILEITGDTMKVAFSSKDEEYPKDFTSTKENKNTVMFLKRVKK